MTLYACPIACSLVSHIALEMTGADFNVRFVDLFAGTHRQPDYIALNPRGKVPLLEVGDERISETIAILAWLNARYPRARLLPDFASAAATGARLFRYLLTDDPAICRNLQADRASMEALPGRTNRHERLETPLQGWCGAQSSVNRYRPKWQDRLSLKVAFWPSVDEKLECDELRRNLSGSLSSEDQCVVPRPTEIF